MESWLDHFASTNFRRSSDTAHDLKTPLNVAVLNLELLRMRVAQARPAARTRRSTPTRRRSKRSCAGWRRSSTRSSSSPRRRKMRESRRDIDFCALCTEAAAEREVRAGRNRRLVQNPRPRFQNSSGAQDVFRGRVTACFGRDRTQCRRRTMRRSSFTVAVTGQTGVAGLRNRRRSSSSTTRTRSAIADLSLAAARLIAETYGGELNALEERDKVSIQVVTSQVNQMKKC